MCSQVNTTMSKNFNDFKKLFRVTIFYNAINASIK